MDGNLVVLGQKGDEKKIAKLFQSSGDGGTWKVAVLVFPSGSDAVGTGLRYEEGKYSGPIVLVLNLKVAQFSFVTLVLYVRGPCMT